MEMIYLYIECYCYHGGAFIRISSMLWLSLLYCFIISCTLALSSSTSSNKKCSRELEKVVYYVDICPFQYMKRISVSLRAQSPLLWTDQAKSVVETFENQYKVKLTFIEPFGMARKYPGGPVAPNAIIHGSAVFRSQALGEGFVNSEVTPYYVYDSLYWNDKGEMYLVKMRLSKDSAPSFC